MARLSHSRLAVLVVGVVGGFLVALPGAAQISPGPLSQVHAELEGSGNCLECHQSRKGVRAELCLSCHEPIAQRLERRRGLHARPEYAACETCHIEHHGREFELIFWGEGGEAGFDHRLTGQPLIGAHATLSCRQCHRPENLVEAEKLVAGGTDLSRTFLGLSGNCRDCHEDEHRDQFKGKSCLQCHNQNSWRPASRFDHDATQFALTGQHLKVDCITCHFSLEPPAERPLQYAGIHSGSCASCHNDPHQGRLGNECASCHNTNGWRAVQSSKIDHDRTRFPLRGEHRTVACKGCHTEGQWLKVGSFDSCSSCHQDAHLGQFRGREDGGSCESCHDEEGFSPAHFSIADHARSRFALTGAHLAVPCIFCHVELPAEEIARLVEPRWRSPVTAGQAAARRFRFAGLGCLDCHRDPHATGAPKGAVSTPVKGAFTDADCLACHGEESWREVSFDHSTTDFKLVGAHRTAGCTQCHASSQGEGEAVSLPFSGAETTCEGCHEDPHWGQFVSAGEPQQCSECHSTEAWALTLFDHNRDSSYMLEGAHTDVACGGCHVAEQRDGVEFIRYKPLASECTDCHGGESK